MGAVRLFDFQAEGIVCGRIVVGVRDLERTPRPCGAEGGLDVLINRRSEPGGDLVDRQVQECAKVVELQRVVQAGEVQAFSVIVLSSGNRNFLRLEPVVCGEGDFRHRVWLAVCIDQDFYGVVRSLGEYHEVVVIVQRRAALGRFGLGVRLDDDNFLYIVVDDFDYDAQYRQTVVRTTVIRVQALIHGVLDGKRATALGYIIRTGVDCDRLRNEPVGAIKDERDTGFAGCEGLVV